MDRPKRRNNSGASTRTVKLVLVCVSTKGEIRACPANRVPLKIALPKVAAAPQQKGAEAIKKKPRPGCLCSRVRLGCCPVAGLLCKHLVQTFRIKADHDLFANDNGGCGTAVVGADQFKNRLLVRTYVFQLKLDGFLRKVGLSP